MVPAVTVLADTKYPVTKEPPNGGSFSRVSTLRLHYGRGILPQLMMHRVFSRSSASSRALPTARLGGGSAAFTPYFTTEQRGMQGVPASQEVVEAATAIWGETYQYVAQQVGRLEALGVHRQHRNRLIEPFIMVDTVVTATDWDNFFTLRLADDSQPEINELARLMKEALDSSTPKISPFHTPYGSGTALADATKKSAAHCAYVSYAKDLDKSPDDLEKIDRFSRRLYDDSHMGPFEHAAVSIVLLRHLDMWPEARFKGDNRVYNLDGWVSTRALLDCFGSFDVTMTILAEIGEIWNNTKTAPV